MSDARGRAGALAVVLLALVWPSAEHLAAPPNKALASVLALVGLLAFAWSGRAPGPAARRPGFGRSLAIGGLVLTLQGASTTLLRHVGWRFHELPLGKAASDLGVWTGERLVTLGLTFEALGHYVIWYVLIGLAVLAALSLPDRGWRSAARTLAGGVGVLAGYAAFRFALTAVLAIELGRPGLLWHPGYTAASWLPLGLLLPRPHLPYRWPLAARRSQVVASGAALASGLCLAFALAYSDPGIVKSGRVLFDEGHANWEWTDQPFDTTAFGIKAEYNYYCLREYLGHFYTVSTSSAEVGPAVLENVDVLIVRTPTAPYSDREIASIVDFVRRGGGLLLIGDHTNLFGMTTYLNAVADRFGMRFRADDTFDLATTGFSTYAATGPALRRALHPALRAVERLDFLTSCTITGGLRTEPAIVGYGLAAEDGAYSHPNFFGNIAFDLCDRFGLFLQAASRRFGKGRVFLFSDSTCFSNFCLFSAGKPELIVGAVDYLNRRGERRPGAQGAGLLAAGALGAAAAVLAVGARGRARSRVGPGSSACGIWLPAVVGLLLGLPLTNRLSISSYGPLRPLVPLSRIVFDVGHSGASFFDYMGAMPGPASRRFEEFYLCAQRAGLHPGGGAIGDLRGDRPAACVIVDPDRPFARAEIDRVLAYVSGGGTLLVLDSVTNSGSTANDILRPFGLQLRVAAALAPAAPAAPDSTRAEIVPTLQAISSSGRVENAGAGSCLAVARAGAGTVLVARDAFRYSASVLGPPLERRLPTESRREVYREVFALYQSLRGGPQGARKSP